MLAQLYVASNRQDQAIEKLTAFVKDNNDVPALMQLAMIHASLKHVDAARAAYEKLLAVSPKFIPALNNLAVLYSDEPGRLDAAYDLAKRAREAAPQEPHTADTLGWILFKEAEYGDALRFLQESAGKLTGAPGIQFHLGMAHYMLGEEGPARLALQLAADANADFAGSDEARRRLAVLAIDARTADAAARSALEGRLRETPDDPVARLRLGELQERDGALDQAANTYEKLLAGDPQFAPATRRLALLNGGRLVDDQKAFEVATKARQAYPDDPELAKTLGILNYRRGNYPQAGELLQSAAAQRTDDAELLFYLGMSYYQLKQWSHTEAALTRALNSGLPARLADEARRTLADCCQPQEAK
jgi:tetratricopeptide (TPR) repeat protein